MARKSSKVAAKQQPAPPAKQGGSPHPMTSLRREMDRLFDRFETDVGSLTDWPFGRSPIRSDVEFGTPAVDFSEDEKEYHLTADLPGVQEKDIEVKLSDDMLTITGERSDEREEEEKDYHLSERRYGSFKRSFRLPESVDQAKIKASFANGVLNLVMPKTKQAKKKARKIDVKAG